MKKILCMMVAMLFIATLSMAQQNRGRGGMRATPEERAKRSVEMLDKQLTLTQTQKDSIYQFSLNEAKEQQALFQGSKDGDDRKEGFEKMRALREKTQQKIKGVLTEEQQKAYDSLMEQRQKQMRERRGGGRNS